MIEFSGWDRLTAGLLGIAIFFLLFAFFGLIIVVIDKIKEHKNFPFVWNEKGDEDK